MDILCIDFNRNIACSVSLIQFAKPVAFQKRHTDLAAQLPGGGTVAVHNGGLQLAPIYPDGKRYPRDVYAHSEEECEALLKEVIREVNTELAEMRKQATAR